MVIPVTQKLGLALFIDLVIVDLFLIKFNLLWSNNLHKCCNADLLLFKTAKSVLNDHLFISYFKCITNYCRKLFTKRKIANAGFFLSGVHNVTLKRNSIPWVQKMLDKRCYVFRAKISLVLASCFDINLFFRDNKYL